MRRSEKTNMNQIEDEFVYPVDVGTWQSYQPYSDPQQESESDSAEDSVSVRRITHR